MKGRLLRRVRWLPVALLGSAAFLGTQPAWSQPPPSSAAQEPESKISVRADLVNLDVTVTDARGNYVRNLKRESFRVLDEGQPQPITNFTPVEAPAQVLLLVETGPAVYLIHRQHLAAAHMLLNGLAADDSVALATYDSEARLLQPFTLDKRGLQGAIPSLRYSMGRSELNLFGSLAAALDWLAATPGKKSLVLLTTGLDDGPPSRWETLLEKLRSSEAAIYPVALGGELRDPPDKNKPAGPDALRVAESFARADQMLKEMAQVTGGQAFFPRRPADFESTYKQIATILRHTYRLGFPPPARDGKFHRVLVQLLDDKGQVLGPFYADLEPAPDQKPRAKGLLPKSIKYRLFFRRGYLAPL